MNEDRIASRTKARHEETPSVVPFQLHKAALRVRLRQVRSHSRNRLRAF